MITSITLVNIQYHTQLQFIFPVMRTFKIYSHSNFKIYNTVLLTIVTNCVLQTHDIYFITRNVYRLTSFTQPSPSASGNHQSVLYIHAAAAAAARSLQSCPTLSKPHGLQPTRLLHPRDSPGQNTGVGCHCLLPTYMCSVILLVPFLFNICIQGTMW